MTTVRDLSPKIQASPDTSPNSPDTPPFSRRALRAHGAHLPRGVRPTRDAHRTWRPLPRGVPLRDAATTHRAARVPRAARAPAEVPRLPRAIGGGNNSDPLGGARLTLSLRDAEWLVSMRPWALTLVARHSVPRPDIEDVVQEAFVVAAIHWSGFTPPLTEPDELARRRWLARILFNTAGRYRYRSDDRDRREVEWTEDLEATLPPRPPRDPVADRELLDRLQHATSPARWRVWLAYEVDGVPVHEIARQEGLTVPGTYNRLIDARRDLAAALRREAASTGGRMIRRAALKRRR